MSFSTLPFAVSCYARLQVGTRYPAKGSFCMEIERRLKTALDESRLLILGAQVLFGFQFDAVFQELFAEIPASSRIIHCAGLVTHLISVGLLIAPSLFHQITFDGESRSGAVTTATVLAGASLLPLTIGLGAAAFVTFEHSAWPQRRHRGRHRLHHHRARIFV
jgi:hypothetical protein